MKIVIIAQNCSPSLGPRQHRTTELAKEFARRGNEVIVYALLGDYDYSYLSKQTGITFKDLGKSRFGIIDNLGYYNKNIFYRAVNKFFGKFFEFPFIELIPMVSKALKKEGSIDYLITIAQPHTIHWGTSHFLKKNKRNIKFWVADCGDPFMKDPFNSRPFYFKKLEKKWGNLCNHISVPIANARNAYYQEFKNKIKIIPQGFQFDNVKLAEYHPNEIPTFAYSGFIYKGKRDVSKFLEYLSNIETQFKFIIYTQNNAVLTRYLEQFGRRLEIRDYVPRKELLFELSKMDFLINISNNSNVQVPSKLIDYALTNRPILEISSEFKESVEIKEFLQGNYRKRKIISKIEQYNIKNIADAFLNLKGGSSGNLA
jgi:hypothetical protein